VFLQHGLSAWFDLLTARRGYVFRAVPRKMHDSIVLGPRVTERPTLAETATG
jgi:hypothetical protein